MLSNLGWYIVLWHRMSRCQFKIKLHFLHNTEFSSTYCPPQNHMFLSESKSSYFPLENNYSPLCETIKNAWCLASGQLKSKLVNLEVPVKKNFHPSVNGPFQCVACSQLKGSWELLSIS